jgi:hypothetical protein
MNVDALREAVRAAASRDDAALAWATLETHSSELAQNRDLAMLWLELCHTTPDRSANLDDACRLADAFPEDPAVVGLAARTLIALAERHAPDEPKLSDDGPAERAAAFAERCLGTLTSEARADKEVGGWLRSLRANALRLSGIARDEQALQAFDEALAIDRDDGHLWFDLALLHKWRGRFQLGFDCNLRAQARLGDTRGVLWNLGICATAIGDGNVAGLCWKKLGFEVDLNPKSGHAFVDNLPTMQVRVLSRGSGYGFAGAVPDQAVGFEVLWVQPFSPCHGVIVSPSFRDAPIDFGDVVLWDGTRVGVGEGPSGPVPRFPLLEVLRPGDERRLRFVALEQHEGDVAGIESVLPDGCQIFVQHERVEHVCPVCASGDALKKHDHLPPQEHRIVYGKLVAPAIVEPPAIRAALDGAVKAAGKVSLAIPGLYELLGDSKRSGQEHQAWRGIERIAIKKGLVAEPSLS